MDLHTLHHNIAIQYIYTKAYLIERTMQPLQNLWPQLVCTGSRSPRRHTGHSYLLSDAAGDQIIHHNPQLRPWLFYWFSNK